MANTATASDFFKCANDLLNFLKALTVIKTIIFNNCFDFTLYDTLDNALQSFLFL